MTQFRKKPLLVDVRGPLTEVETVWTANGRVIAHVGDYVLTDVISGNMWPIKPRIFAATYEPVEEQGVAEPSEAWNSPQLGTMIAATMPQKVGEFDVEADGTLSLRGQTKFVEYSKDGSPTMVSFHLVTEKPEAEAVPALDSYVGQLGVVASPFFIQAVRH